MTVYELMNDEMFEYEICIDESYSENECCDEWGMITIWFGNIGVEYNYCVDNGTYPCAFYAMKEDDEENWYTDYSNFIDYNIDWSDCEWKNNLLVAACNALIKLFDL